MPGPLASLKILDFTALLPGPYATMYLADLGARVVKVASRIRPDPVELLPPFLEEGSLSAASAYLGRGKRSLALNLKDPRAREVVGRLVKEYDILIEQFRPGVMARLNLDYESLRRENPALIYCSLTGYGQSGPLSRRAGHDINYLARSGLMAYSGRKETGPTLPSMQVADLAGGSLQAVIGILAAVVHREKTGQGQCLDVAMTDGLLSFHALAGAAFLVDGVEPERENTALNGGSLYDFYETADGGYLSFGGLEPQFFGAFCAALGRGDLIPGGVCPPEAAARKKELRALIRSKTLAEWVEVFREVDACAEPVLSLSQALYDPHIRARGMVVELTLSGGGKVRQVASPIKFSRTPPSYGKAGVTPGSDTGEILREAGYSSEEIAGGEKTGLFI